jgi:hypothetical protein
VCGLPRGAVEKKKRKRKRRTFAAAPKKSSYLLHFIFMLFFYLFFWAFRNKGSSKTRKNFFSEKIHLGSSQKMRFFFPPFFFPLLRLFCSIFFNRVFGRFVTRGVQKRDQKKSHENLLSFQKKYLLTYVASFFIFLRRPLGLPPAASGVGARRTRGAQRI